MATRSSPWSSCATSSRVACWPRTPRGAGTPSSTSQAWSCRGRSALSSTRGSGDSIPRRQRVLEMASVAGRDFHVEVIASALGLDEIAILGHIEAAARASLVRETGVGHFQFAHALVQHALYEELGATRQALHHRQLALALEAAHPAVPAAVLATHWSATGRDPERVAEWARRAGDDAIAALSPEDAIRWYQAALDALGPDDDGTRVDLLIALGIAQRWADTSAFRQTLLDAATLAEGVGDGDALVRAALANNRGGASRAGAVDVERVDVLERAVAVVGTDDTPNGRGCSQRSPSSCRRAAIGNDASPSPSKPSPVRAGSATRSRSCGCSSTPPRRPGFPRRSINASSIPRSCSRSRSG